MCAIFQTILFYCALTSKTDQALEAMWLLSAACAELHSFVSPEAVPDGYAILSHVWQEGKEQTLQDISDPSVKDPYNPWNHISQKIRDCCAFAASEGFEWLWIDTCCIDKTSSSELSEAIKSMYAKGPFNYDIN